MSERRRRKNYQEKARGPLPFVNENSIIDVLMGSIPRDDRFARFKKKLDFDRPKPNFRILMALALDLNNNYSELVRGCVHWKLFRLYAVLRDKRRQTTRYVIGYRRLPAYTLLQLAAVSGNGEFYQSLVKDQVKEKSTFDLCHGDIAEYFGLINSTIGQTKSPEDFGININFDSSNQSLYAFKKLLRRQLPWESIVPHDAHKYWEGLYKSGKVPFHPYYRSIEYKKVKTAKMIRGQLFKLRKDILKHNVFKIHDHYNKFRYERPKSTDDVSYLSTKSFVTQDMVGMHSVVDQDTFINNFHIYTNDIFHEFNWDNVLAVGGSVVACLIEDFNNLGHIDTDEYILDKYGDSDIDLYLYGFDTYSDYENKVVEIATSIFRVYSKCKIIQTPNTYTFVFGWPIRHIQLILANFQSINHILFGSDIQASGVGFDGTDIWTTDSSKIAYNRRWTILTQEAHKVRGSPSYESRCVKYSLRGFQIVDLQLNKRGISIDDLNEKISPLDTDLRGHERILYYLKYPDLFLNRPPPVIRFYEGITVKNILASIDEYNNEPVEYLYGQAPRVPFKRLEDTGNARIPQFPISQLECYYVRDLYAYITLIKS